MFHVPGIHHSSVTRKTVNEGHILTEQANHANANGYGSG